MITEKTVPPFSIKAILNTAYREITGAKKPILMAFGLILLVGFSAGLLSGLLSEVAPLFSSLINLIGRLVVIVLQSGLLYLGILRSRALPIHFSEIFRAFKKRIALSLIGVYVIQFLIFTGILLLFVFLPAFLNGHIMLKTLWIAWMLVGALLLLFVIIRMMFARGLVIDRMLGPWQATCESFRMTKDHVLPLCALVVCQCIVLLVGAALLFIGLIWAIPFVVIAYGLAYRALSLSTAANTSQASSI